MFVSERPVVNRRGVHLELKGVPPTPHRLVQLLKVFAAARYNVVLVEWEDTFPWTVDKRFRSPTAYSPEDVKLFVDTARELNIELIPLVQCLGHMETVLDIPDYEKLREVPDHSECLNPLAPGAREIVQSMVDDVLKLMPDTKHFHLGGDEAHLFGQHPDTKVYVEEHGRGALYMHHIGPILDNLNQRGIRPVLWHDMMLDWDSEALKSLAALSDLMVWGYSGSPDKAARHFKTEYIKRFAEHGIQMWGGAGYKGCGDEPERHVADRPITAKRVENALAWADVAKRFDFKGVVATAWSRFSNDTMQCEPIDSALDAAFAVGVALHDGQVRDGTVDACIEAMDSIGERDRFIACRDAMVRLTAVRRAGWEKIQIVRQQMALAKRDKRRRCARNIVQGMKVLSHLAAIVKHSEKIDAEVRSAFDGLMDTVWLDEYLATRLDPLRDELAELEAMYEGLPGALSPDVGRTPSVRE